MQYALCNAFFIVKLSYMELLLFIAILIGFVVYYPWVNAYDLDLYCTASDRSGNRKCYNEHCVYRQISIGQAERPQEVVGGG